MKIQVSADLLDGLVLALLERKDYYGYALTQDMQKAITISESTLYPVLRRLKEISSLKRMISHIMDAIAAIIALRLLVNHIWHALSRYGKIIRKASIRFLRSANIL